MNQKSIKLKTYELLAEYAHRKIISGGGNSCLKKEFEELLKGLNTYIKRFSHSNINIVFDEPDFEKAAKNCVEKIPRYKKWEFEYKDGVFTSAFSFNQLEIEDFCFPQDVKNYFSELKDNMESLFIYNMRFKGDKT